MTVWAPSQQVNVVDFNYAFGVEVSFSLHDDGTLPEVGEYFDIRVTTAVIGGGFDAYVWLYVPAHVSMLNFGLPIITVFPPLNTPPTTVPGSHSEIYRAVARCTLDSQITVKFRVFYKDYFATVNLKVIDRPFAPQIPAPAVGKIVYSKIDPGYSSQSFYTINSDGTADQRIRPKYYGDKAVWSPDGQQIAFTVYTDAVMNLFVMNSDGSNVRQLTQHVTGYCDAPRWSFNGARIMYTYHATAPTFKRSVHVIDINGTNDTEQIHSSVPGIDVSNGVWMRDGRWAALRYNRSTKATDILVGADDFNSGTENVIALSNLYGYGTLASTKNHDHLLLQATPLAGERIFSEIHVCNLVGNSVGKQFLFTDVVGNAPSFSPDGNWVVYSNQDVRDKTHLARFDMNGLHEVAITQVPMDPNVLASDSVPEWA